MKRPALQSNTVTYGNPVGYHFAQFSLRTVFFTCDNPFATVLRDMSSSRKKIIARKLTRNWVGGYLPAAGFARQGSLEILELSGKLLTLTIQELKWVCFVRDFNSGEIDNPERLLRKTFAGRPRGEGLWLRLRLQDGDLLEGLAENNLSLLDADGFFLTPPDTRGNTQRIWLPKSSVTELEVVAVIGGAGKKKATPMDKPDTQETLFPISQ
jgi:hypothetical protein